MIYKTLHKKPANQATQTPQKTGGEPGCFGMISSSIFFCLPLYCSGNKIAAGILVFFSFPKLMTFICLVSHKSH